MFGLEARGPRGWVERGSELGARFGSVEGSGTGGLLNDAERVWHGSPSRTDNAIS